MTEDMANKTGRILSNTLFSANDRKCSLPWEDFVESNPDTDVDIPILICLLLTLVFDTILVAIILLHQNLRKKVRNFK